MKILITVNSSWNVINFRRPLIDAFLKDGHDVLVLAPDDGFGNALEGLGCRFHPLLMDLKGLSPGRDFGLMLQFARHFGRLKPDVILSFTIKNNIYGAFAARLLRIPFMPTVTGLGTAFLSGSLLRFFTEALYRNAFAATPFVFFQNRDDETLFVSRRLVRPSQARRVPGSGIDLDHFRPRNAFKEDGRPVFLMIARLLRDKGVLEYAEAARRVLKQHPNTKFVMVGPVSPENRSAVGEEVVQAWRREGVIEHLGEMEDVRPHIAAADCIVLPSYREGAPRTLIEAAAVGKPIIATDVPGCRDVVENGITGFLCQPRDAQSLTEAMLRMISMSGEERARMGAAGRVRMEAHYDHRVVVAAYRDALTRGEADVGAAGHHDTWIASRIARLKLRMLSRDRDA